MVLVPNVSVRNQSHDPIIAEQILCTFGLVAATLVIIVKNFDKRSGISEGKSFIDTEILKDEPHLDRI